MATGKLGDLNVYSTLMQTAAYEALAQNVNAFNGASNGAILLEAANVPGYYKKESFFKRFGAAARRDITSVAAAADTTMTQGEHVDVKRFAKWGPYSMDSSFMRTLGLGTWEEAAIIAGQQYGEEQAKLMLNSLLIAGEACLSKQASTKYDYSGTGTVTHAALVSGLAKLGDAADRIVCWVMHSKAYYNLVAQAISDKITNVADGVIIAGATPGTLGRPVVITDSAALLDENGSLTDTYNTLGLTAGALKATLEPNDTVFADIVSGLENIVFRYQANFEFGVHVQGFSWDESGANPSDSDLGTSSKWGLEVSDVKSGPGVVVITQ